MGREIFISYSRDDKALVHPFVEQISKAVGKDCWIDMKGIESGEEFEEVIMKAIDECEVMLFMLSDSSLKKSKWTKREVYYAEDEGKRIVPVLIDGDKLRGWFKFHFGNVDYIDIRSEEQKQKLISNLRDWLGVEEERKAEEEAKKKLEEEAKRKVGEEARKAEEEAKCKAEDEAIRKSEEGIVFHKERLSIITPNEKEKSKRLWRTKIFATRKKWIVATLTVLAIVIIGALIALYSNYHKIIYESAYEEGMAKVKNRMGYCGFKDESGKVVIPCKWKGAHSFSEGLAPVADDNGKCGFIDKTGKVVVPCKRERADPFFYGLAAVMDDSLKWGYIDKTGKVVIPCVWRHAYPFSGGLASVQDDNRKRWTIDKTGKVVKEGW